MTKSSFAIFLLLILVGCQSKKRITRREEYLKNPEAYHKVIMQLHEQIQKDRLYKRFVLIDPNYMPDEVK